MKAVQSVRKGMPKTKAIKRVGVIVFEMKDGVPAPSIQP